MFDEFCRLCIEISIISINSETAQGLQRAGAILTIVGKMKLTLQVHFGKIFHNGFMNIIFTVRSITDQVIKISSVGRR